MTFQIRFLVSVMFIILFLFCWTTESSSKGVWFVLSMTYQTNSQNHITSIHQSTWVAFVVACVLKILVRSVIRQLSAGWSDSLLTKVSKFNMPFLTKRTLPTDGLITTICSRLCSRGRFPVTPNIRWKIPTDRPILYKIQVIKLLIPVLFQRIYPVSITWQGDAPSLVDNCDYRFPEWNSEPATCTVCDKKLKTVTREISHDSENMINSNFVWF